MYCGSVVVLNFNGDFSLFQCGVWCHGLGTLQLQIFLLDFKCLFVTRRGNKTRLSFLNVL